MAKDHFVPQHYLRNFGLNPKEIMAAKISPYRFIGAVPINGQCQEKNFYEKNEPLDQLIWQSENDLAPILANIIRNKSFDSQELSAIKYLASIFHVRTRKAAELAKVFPKYMALEVIGGAIERGEVPKPPGGELTEDMVDFGKVSGLLIQQALACWMEMHTLGCKLLQCATGASFITSDNPVVILNQACSGENNDLSYAGFSLSGFQLLLPINPTLCLIFFDDKVYKVGNRRETLVTISKNDVEMVNALQLQAAEECIYFENRALESNVRSLVECYSNLRKPLRDSLRVLPGRDGKEDLLHFRAQGATLPSAWSFCRLRRRANFEPGQRRNNSWTELEKAVMADIEMNPGDEDLFLRIQNAIDRLYPTAG